MDKIKLEKYADLIVKTGINIKSGQDVIIRAQLDQPEFVSMVAEKCYQAGARKVTVEWSHQPIEKININYRSLETLLEVNNWEISKMEYLSETLPAMIYLLSENPDGLNGIDSEKYTGGLQARSKVLKPIRDKMDNKYQWCIAAVPGIEWAAKVFPDESKENAVNKLWDAILYTSRVTEDPISEWDNHNKDLLSRCEYLNSLDIKTLEYKSSNGTDLRVGLIPNSAFAGGGEYTESGNYFNPNIPSEEVFISPMRGEAEGIVYSTKPLCYNGQTIDHFNLTFKDGRVVECHAEVNEELLKKIISMDEGASYLGECALVPYDSPINNSGILFYNTLFDENAACHLALGAGFTNCINNYNNYSREELIKMGVNDSSIHEDFMIGSEDLSITGIKENGERVEIFKNGNWAF